MKNFRLKILTFAGMVFMLSCSKVRPAEFWENFHTDMLVHALHDNGPNGGQNEYYWSEDTSHTFTAKELLAFATKNGWQVCDSLSFSSATLTKWDQFPFTYSDFKDSIFLFHNWIKSDAKLYRFTSGWIAVEPGNARETSKNGYVLISASGTELAVYQLWGE